MGRRKKLAIWGVLVLGTAAGLLAAVFFLAPAVLNSPDVKAKIRGSVSGAIHGEVDYRKLDFALFPDPHLVFRDPDIAIRNTSGKMKSLSLYPQIAPLFKGNVRIAKMIFEQPDFTVRLPEKKDRVLRDNKKAL